MGDFLVAQFQVFFSGHDKSLRIILLDTRSANCLYFPREKTHKWKNCLRAFYRFVLLIFFCFFFFFSLSWFSFVLVRFLSVFSLKECLVKYAYIFFSIHGQWINNTHSVKIIHTHTHNTGHGELVLWMNESIFFYSVVIVKKKKRKNYFCLAASNSLWADAKSAKLVT